MKQSSSTKALVESGLLTAIAVILVLISIYIPVFYFIGIFIWPLPITLIYIRHGFKYSLMSLIVTGIITAMTYDPMSALASTITVGFLGLVLGYCVKNKKPASLTLIIMSASMFFSMAFVYIIFSLVIGQNPIDITMNMMSKSMDMARQMYLKAGISKEQVDLMTKTVFNIELYRMIIPSMFILSSIIMSFFIYVVSGKILKRFGYNLEKIKPFSQWYMPSQIATGTILILIIGFILYQTKVSNAEKYLFNAQIIFQYAFILIGLSSITYWLNKKGTSKLLSGVILFIIITTPMFFRILAVVGVLDYSLNLRKLDPKRNRRYKDI